MPAMYCRPYRQTALKGEEVGEETTHHQRAAPIPGNSRSNGYREIPKPSGLLELLVAFLH